MKLTRVTQVQGRGHHNCGTIIVRLKRRKRKSEDVTLGGTRRRPHLKSCPKYVLYCCVMARVVEDLGAALKSNALHMW